MTEKGQRMPDLFYKDVNWKVVYGPDRNTLFRCMMIARDTDTDEWAVFTLEGVPADEPGVIHVINLIVLIDGLQHAGLNGRLFTIDSSFADGCGWNLKIERYDTQNRTGQGVKLYM